MSDTSVAGRMTLFALLLGAGCAADRPGNHTAPVITGQVDETQLVRLEGNTRPEITLHPEYDRGPVADTYLAEHMLLQLKRSPVAEHLLEQAIEQLQTPGSPRYHQWLTAQEYGDQFGLADSDVAAVTSWLSGHGLRVNFVNPGRTLLDFSGTAAQLREAFHTELHALDVKGTAHIANISDPQIPAALAPAVGGVVSMHDFRPHHNHKARANPATTFSLDNQTFHAVSPEDLATIYNLKPLFTAGVSGQGQTVVVVEDSDVYSTDDWNLFRTKFGLSTYTAGTFNQVHPAPASGSNNCAPPGANGADSEAILDAEWASASAPSAAIVLASCADTFSFGGLIALDNLLATAGSTPPSAVSMSYGQCETFTGAAANAAFGAVFQQAVAQGVSVFVSSGDEDSASCDDGASAATFGIGVSGWASTPYNVSVGGTDLGDAALHSTASYWNATNDASFGSATSYIPEIPWNDSCASALIVSAQNYTSAYGSRGFCNSSAASNDGLLAVAGGSGGPSGCATGSPSITGVVSGSCRGWAKPSWQSVYGNPNDGVRDIPDVSLFAANGIWGHYLIYCDADPSDQGQGQTDCSGTDPSTWQGAGGTSFSSPIMAGIQALVDQKWGGRQGNPNPIYYQIAAAEYGTTGNSGCNATNGNAIDPSCSFNDVTLGDIDVACTGPFSCYMPGGTEGALSTSLEGYAPAFSAHTGWDFATGIGSVNAANLVNNTAWGDGQTNLSWTPPHP